MPDKTGKQAKTRRKRQPTAQDSPDVKTKRSPHEQKTIAREWEQQGHEWEAEGHDRVYPNPGWKEGGYGHEQQGYEWERAEGGREQTEHIRKPRRGRGSRNARSSTQG